MPDDQEKDDHQSTRPHLKLRIHSKGSGPNAVTIQPDTPDSFNDTTGGAMDEEKTAHRKDGNKSPVVNVIPLFRSENLPRPLQWIPANWNWSRWKPVLKSALAAWISLLLFLIPTTLNVMGQAAFLIIIASFFSPPSDPFISVLQRELGILTFAVAGWGWSCLGIKLADLARTNKNPAASAASIFAGDYIEAGPTVVMAVFLFIGSVFLLYVKSRVGPGPITFACIFGLICIDIALTTAVLFPYPYYMIGQIIVLPLAFHSAVSLTLSLCLFPASESASFTTRLHDVLSALLSATKEHHQCLKQDVTAPEFSASSIIAAVGKAESALALLASTSRLQKLDVIYSRFAPADYGQLHTLTRQLIVKAGGMCVYYTLIDPTREKFPVTPAASVPGTPAFSTPAPSRPPSPGRERSSTDVGHLDAKGSLDGETNRPSYRRCQSSPRELHQIGAHHHHKPKRHSSHRHATSHHPTHSHSSLLHVALNRARRTEQAVGVFESINYLNLEAAHMSHPDSDAHVARASELLSTSCQDLIESCERGLRGTCDWLSSVSDGRFTVWVSHEERRRILADRLQKYEDLHSELSQTLDDFATSKRFTVLDPYRALFTSADDTLTERDVTPHRHLFNCFVYQYHLMRFATSIRDMLGEIIRLENERKVPRVWFPKIHWSKLVHPTTWEPSEIVEGNDDENPDTIPGLDETTLTDLGQAVRRDPDALPPRNALEKGMNWVYHVGKGIGGGNALFALKAGALTIILSLPSFLDSSAEYAYKNKFVWAVIMGQLTLARFRGDTTFGLVARIISTFVGGIIGVVMWYISTGSGQGNAFGLAAVCFVCFPIFFFFRLYWPVPPMTNLIIWITAALVFGYSYQDTHLASTSSPGYGIDVAWRRFVLVTVGVVAAGIFSFFPPSTTIRLYERKTLATTSTEIGSIYCSIVSFAHAKKEDETAVIVQRILAILSKLKRSIMLKENVVYEFSLRGKWPAERYQRILELQLQISGLLSHLLSVLGQMEPVWAHAFLKRTRMLDPNFLGDVLAVISLISSSLRTGNPLPQVTPCPLLNRFMERPHGLNVVHEEAEEDFGLPKALTEETLESLQYLTFCVGVSTTFGFVTRLDKLMFAVKELVGEQYHIDGVGLPLYYRRAQGAENQT